MNTFPSKVKQKLDELINNLSEHHWLYCNNPGHDFTRQHLGKLSFRDTMLMTISMGKGDTDHEISHFFDLDVDRIPSQPAFNQRRSQITVDAFKLLFSEFSASFPNTTHQFYGKSILAGDGCHVCYSTNAQILEDYNKPKLLEHKGHNHMHLNGFVDVISKAFIDAEIQPGQHPDERAALQSMIDSFNPDDPSLYIITADRGYECYDLIFQCESKNLFFVFRMKDPSSRGSILSSFKDQLPDELEEFDVSVSRFFTDCKNRIMKDQTSVYHYMNPNKNVTHFGTFLGEGNHLRYLSFRVVKIKTGENSYEYVITNLPSLDFDIDKIRACYHWRWGIEVAFRYLKHAAGLLYFHSKKPEFLKQEIYASLVLYNFGIFIANEATKENRKVKRKPTNKYIYDVNFTSAIEFTRDFILKYEHKKLIDLIGLLLKFVHPVKEPFRKFERCLQGIGAIRLNYR